MAGARGSLGAWAAADETLAALSDSTVEELASGAEDSCAAARAGCRVSAGRAAETGAVITGCACGAVDTAARAD